MLQIKGTSAYNLASSFQMQDVLWKIKSVITDVHLKKSRPFFTKFDQILAFRSYAAEKLQVSNT